MSACLTVVIPALDEEAHIGAAIATAFAAGASEVIVCDGGSSDPTIEIARERGAMVLNGETMRSRQLNRGAERATGDCVLFLHADSLLPVGAARAACDALDRGAVFGGFRLAFVERAAKLHVVESMINLRTFLTRCPWGDQAQFIRRDTFLRSGGFLEIPIMEDYELAIRMKRNGPIAILPLTVTTSGRRFLDKGVWRATAINWRIIAAWHLGADPEKLARIYRR